MPQTSVSASYPVILLSGFQVLCQGDREKISSVSGFSFCRGRDFGQLGSELEDRRWWVPTTWSQRGPDGHQHPCQHHHTSYIHSCCNTQVIWDYLVVMMWQEREITPTYHGGIIGHGSKNKMKIDIMAHGHILMSQ